MLEMEEVAILIEPRLGNAHLRLRLTFFHDCGLDSELVGPYDPVDFIPNDLLVCRGVKILPQLKTPPC